MFLPAITDGITQGVGIHYEMGSAEYFLIGKPVPDIPGTEEAMRFPRPALFDLSGSIDLRAAVDGWTDRLDVLALTASTDLGALLVRPDGYVAWAVDGEVEAGDLLELRGHAHEMVW